MTYGWAILIILIAIGALFYLGVFSPSTPSTCTASAPIMCNDVKADATSDDIIISLGASSIEGLVTINDFAVSSPTGYLCDVNQLTPLIPDDPITMPASDLLSTPKSITCTAEEDNELAVGAKLSGTVNVGYTLQGGTSHTTTVQFSGTVEA